MWVKTFVAIAALVLVTCPATATDEDPVVGVKKSQLVQLLKDNAQLRAKLVEAQKLLSRGSTALGQCTRKIEELQSHIKRDSCA